MKFYYPILLALMFTLFPPGLFAADSENTKLVDALSAKHREQSANRDKYRHPEQTLNFFQVKDNHKVIEIWPGGGAWYTEILAPYLRGKGTLYAAQYNPDTTNNYQKRTLQTFNNKLKANPEVYDKVKVAIFNPPEDFQLGAPESIDRVLTFRNVHNWMRFGEEGVLAAFQAFYQVLKPGGKLGVIDHRLPEGRDKGTGGYVKQSYVIKVAEAAGFELEGSTEINANAKDSADHPKGVWTLPPTLTLKEKDREKYLAIGESDRMTLLFVKK